MLLAIKIDNIHYCYLKHEVIDMFSNVNYLIIQYY